MAAQVSTLILAGGQSTRFGRDKASALLHGRPMLEWVARAIDAAHARGLCSDLVVASARGQVLPPLSVAVPVIRVEDRVPAAGPLGGLVAGLPLVRREHCFVVACDAPLLRPGVIELLAPGTAGVDAVLPRVGGYPQPLVAVYRVASCLPAFEAGLSAGEGRVLAALASLRVDEVGEDELREVDPDLRSFLNANTPDRLRQIEAILAGEPAIAADDEPAG